MMKNEGRRQEKTHSSVEAEATDAVVALDASLDEFVSKDHILKRN